jgi:hypothetical protein
MSGYSRDAEKKFRALVKNISFSFGQLPKKSATLRIAKTSKTARTKTKIAEWAFLPEAHR